MKAFVLCGGEGTRLRPYTYTVPKPMLPIAGKPIVQYVLENLMRAGIKDFTLTLGYLAEQFEEYFKNGKELGVKIEHAVEDEKLNTAGSVLPHKDKVKGTFVVVMGDHITNIDVKKMLSEHKNSGAVVSIALLRKKIPLQFGIAQVDGSGLVTTFREKPLIEYLYNVAIYVCEPEIFNYINEKEDFAQDVFPRILENGGKINSFIFDGVWFDIGQVSEYERLNEEFQTAQLLKDLGHK
ncbi:TPA: nucleotidyltransferase family protein [Candidatus Micrarchaeota archaeon]|nr:nucleotidyltransferase family protein [Candidatus Micrarchaeota archaeon]